MFRDQQNKDFYNLPITMISNGKFKDNIEIKWSNPEIMDISLQQGNIHASPLTYEQFN